MVQQLFGQLDTLTAHKKTLTTYLLSKVTAEDWHGVADAAMDIRDTEAEIKGIRLALDLHRETQNKPEPSR